MEENIDLNQVNYNSTQEGIEIENYYTEVLKYQEQQIEILKEGFQFTITLMGVIIGTLVIIAFLRSVFRYVGN